MSRAYHAALTDTVRPSAQDAMLRLRQVTFALGFLALFVLLGIALIVGGLRFRRRLHGLQQSGVTVLAEVVELREVPGGEHGPALCPVVRFRTRAGVDVETLTLAGTTPTNPEVGERVAVRYDPAEPQKVALEHGLASGVRLGAILIWFGAFDVATAVALALAVLIRRD